MDNYVKETCIIDDGLAVHISYKCVNVINRTEYISTNGQGPDYKILMRGLIWAFYSLYGIAARFNIAHQ